MAHCRAEVQNSIFLIQIFGREFGHFETGILRICRTKVVFDISTENITSGVLASSTTAVVNSLHDRKSQTHVSSSRRHHRNHRDRGQDAEVKRTSASAARRKHQHEKLGVNDIGKHMHTHSCSHVDDVKVDSLEDYQHMLQALYGEELVQQDQGNVSASDSGAEQSDQESSRRRHKRLPKQVLESQWSYN
eukprot:g8699.t1